MKKTKIVYTGFDELDNLIGGLRGGQVVVIAGRPGMGKRTFATNIAINNSIKAEDGVYLYSLEVSTREYIKRIISLIGEIDLEKMNDGKLDDKGWEKIIDAANKIGNSRLIIDDNFHKFSYDYFCDTLRKLAKEKKVSLAIIDYIQLMGDHDRFRFFYYSRYSSMRFGFGLLIEGLKELSRKLNIPIIILSQITRRCEKELDMDHHPILSDLDHIGFPTYYADMVLFVYRENYYLEEWDRLLDHETIQKNKSVDKYTDAEIIVAKHPTIVETPITVQLSFNPHKGGFNNL